MLRGAMNGARWGGIKKVISSQDDCGVLLLDKVRIADAALLLGQWVGGAGQAWVVRMRDQWSAAQAALVKLRPNNRAAKMTIVGPTVGSLKKNILSRNPATTESMLAAEETRRKFESLSVICRAVAAGRIIRALASRVPMKRRPTRMVRLKTKRK